MKNNISKIKKFSVCLLALSVSQALAADEEANKKGLDFERIAVTGVVKGKNVMDSSVSISSVDLSSIEVATPRTTAEIFRLIPGVRSEATGGEGNANIAVRGLPVASGGAKFLQLQEDGLPVLQFGDIAFGNADIFLRADSTVSSVESIRGGSASTLASNSPGGIINLISKTGEDDGGSVATTFGVDYDSFKTDFEYGTEISDTLRFHIGGFVRQGDGPRDAGYTANKGGQIKANITKDFDNGYVRLYFKHLDDNSIGYLPMPVRGDGSSLPGFDSLSDTPHSAYFTKTFSRGKNGELRSGDIRDGMSPLVDSFGVEASFDLGNDWQVENRFRKSSVSGTFNAPFPAEVGETSAVAESIAGSGATLEYANGPQAGNSYNEDYVMRIHTFDVEMDDFDNIVNDIKLTKTLDSTNVTFGYYVATQNIGMSWLWNSYLLEQKGDNAALVNAVAQDGTSYSDNGLYAYGTPFWGNCCQRNYDADYTITAPYVAVTTDYEDFTFDASVRYDSGEARGTYAGATTSTYDMNGDGVISMPEVDVVNIDNANASPINYDWNYTSYSVGVNYKIDNDTAVFGRISHGGRANADRLLFGKVRPDGSVASADAIDEVDQIEAGVKYRQNELAIFATAFYAETEEQNFEATSQRFFDRQYEAMGVEVEASYFVGNFDLRGHITLTDAEITKDALNESVVGNTPRRQADVVYSFTGRYSFESAAVGANFIGSSGAYAQDSNELEFDAYTQFNLFADYNLSDNLTVSLNINNAFDSEGITESEEGALPANDIIRARTLTGRTTSFTLRYMF
ncbi:TonB-dependent receptor domain-containing protein [Psychrosphaera aestuarii]|uniref:TonB-dependent receptor domain-containing protein n=1 Tax=Psychrosphaera aestuarii TaxID=1266052 RepID=UPI001B31C627|nr:TonB-dependent receptor [Psychrosphaera aestuarii]